MWVQNVPSTVKVGKF